MHTHANTKNIAITRIMQVRNQLVHDRECNAIPGDRKRFIADFEQSLTELNEIIAKREGRTDTSQCVIS